MYQAIPVIFATDFGKSSHASRTLGQTLLEALHPAFKCCSGTDEIVLLPENYIEVFILHQYGEDYLLA